jgi:hypothetical protein
MFTEENTNRSSRELRDTLPHCINTRIARHLINTVDGCGLSCTNWYVVYPLITPSFTVFHSYLQCFIVA